MLISSILRYTDTVSRYGVHMCIYRSECMNVYVCTVFLKVKINFTTVLKNLWLYTYSLAIPAGSGSSAKTPSNFNIDL